MGVHHTYKIQLIRSKPGSFIRDHAETIELEKSADSYKEAERIAVSFGAVRERGKRQVYPRIVGAQAAWPCADKRFERVQIVIMPLISDQSAAR